MCRKSAQHKEAFDGTRTLWTFTLGTQICEACLIPDMYEGMLGPVSKVFNKPSVVATANKLPLGLNAHTASSIPLSIRFMSCHQTTLPPAVMQCSTLYYPTKTLTEVVSS